MVSEAVARSCSGALGDSTITLYSRFVDFLIIGPFLLMYTISLDNVSPVFTLAEYLTHLSLVLTCSISCFLLRGV